MTDTQSAAPLTADLYTGNELVEIAEDAERAAVPHTPRQSTTMHLIDGTTLTIEDGPGDHEVIVTAAVGRDDRVIGFALTGAEASRFVSSVLAAQSVKG